MRRPIISLIWDQAARIRRLQDAVVAADRLVDELRQELTVAKRREKRWRHAALDAARRVGPDFHAWIEMQATSDDVADLPETTERNAAPRSLP